MKRSSTMKFQKQDKTEQSTGFGFRQPEMKTIKEENRNYAIQEEDNETDESESFDVGLAAKGISLTPL